MDRGYLDLIEAIFEQSKRDYFNASKWLILHPDASDKNEAKKEMVSLKRDVTKFLGTQWASYLAQTNMNAKYIISRWDEEVRKICEELIEQGTCENISATS